MTGVAPKLSAAREVIAAMTAYTLELRQADIKLNQNESPSDFPRVLKEEVLARLAARPWNLYPDFEAMLLRGAIAKAHGIQPENVLAGNGSNELLAAAIATFVGPGTPVVFPMPTFTLYEKLVVIAGGLPVPVAVDPATGLLPLEAMLRELRGRGNAVAIVCSPNNPTGGVLPAGGTEALLATGATVLFDRAYGDFAGDGVAPGSTTVPLAADHRLVTFSTFSKAWGLAGLRVGWLASTADTCREIRKVKLPYSLNILSEAVAAAALENPWIRDRNVALAVSERQRLFAALEAIDGVAPLPSQANFIAFRVRRDPKEVFEELCARGVLIRNISPALPGCLRVSIGSAVQNDRFLALLKEIA